MAIKLDKLEADLNEYAEYSEKLKSLLVSTRNRPESWREYRSMSRATRGNSRCVCCGKTCGRYLSDKPVSLNYGNAVCYDCGRLYDNLVGIKSKLAHGELVSAKLLHRFYTNLRDLPYLPPSLRLATESNGLLDILQHMCELSERIVTEFDAAKKLQ